MNGQSQREAKNYIIVGLVFTLVQFSLTNASARLHELDQGDAAGLNSPVTHDIGFSGRPSAALVEILQDTGVNGGVVERHTCGIEPQVELTVKQGTTVRQALETLVAKNPAYEWGFQNNVVDLTPKTGLPAIFNARLRKYQVHTMEDWRQEANFGNVFDSPEIRKRIADLKLGGGMMVAHGGPVSVDINPTPPKLRPIDINIHDISLEEALNVVANAYGNTVWAYTEFECNGHTTFTIEGLHLNVVRHP